MVNSTRMEKGLSKTNEETKPNLAASRGSKQGREMIAIQVQPITLNYIR